MFGIEIGVGVNAKGFDAGLQQVGAKLKAFASTQFAQYFGASALLKGIGNVYDYLKATIDDIKQVKIGAIKMGVDKTTFMQMRNGLEASEASAEQLETALVHVATAMELTKEATPEGEKALAAFDALGVSFHDLQTKSRQRIFAQIADNLREVANNGEIAEKQLAALRDVMGRGAIDLVPFMARGDNANDLAGIPTEDQIRQLQESGKAMAGIKALLKDMKLESVLWAEAIADVTKMLFYIGTFRFGKAKDAAEHTEDKEAAAQQELIEKMRKKVQAVADRKSAAANEELARKNQEQRNREEISQAEFDRDEHLQKAKPKSEQLADIQKERDALKARLERAKMDEDEMASLNDLGRRFSDPQGVLKGAKDDVLKRNNGTDPGVNRARIEAEMARLAAEAKSLQPESRIPKLGLTENQRIGAAIGVPGISQPLNSIAASSAKTAASTAKMAAQGAPRRVAMGNMFEEPNLMA